MVRESASKEASTSLRKPVLGMLRCTVSLYTSWMPNSSVLAVSPVRSMMDRNTSSTVVCESMNTPLAVPSGRLIWHAMGDTATSEAISSAEGGSARHRLRAAADTDCCRLHRQNDALRATAGGSWCESTTAARNKKAATKRRKRCEGGKVQHANDSSSHARTWYLSRYCESAAGGGV